MAAAIKIRALVRDGLADVRVLVPHEMESGRRRDAAGQPIPAWYVTELTVALNGRPVLQAHWGPAISKNPMLQLRLQGARPGDRITVSWVDSRGERRTDEAAVA